MNKITELKATVEGLILATETMCNEAPQEPTLDALKARGTLITELAATVNTLTFLLQNTLHRIDLLQGAQERDLKAYAETTSAQKGRKSYARATQGPRDQEQSRAKSRIKITPGLSLAAIKVPTADQVRQDGNLYYIEQYDHFAFVLSGHLYHGNIGTVYFDEKAPEKVKDCKFIETCMKGNHCDYYHNPTQFRGSRDCRNYIASSFSYVPPSGRRGHQLSRKYGSRQYLDTDMATLTDNDAARFHDQATHDLLCSLLLRAVGK